MCEVLDYSGVTGGQTGEWGGGEIFLLVIGYIYH